MPVKCMEIVSARMDNVFLMDEATVVCAILDTRRLVMEQCAWVSLLFTFNYFYPMQYTRSHERPV